MSTVFVITGNGLGRGDEALGRRLMTKLAQQSTSLEPRPEQSGAIGRLRRRARPRAFDEDRSPLR